jgi:hypothetical protein
MSIKTLAKFIFLEAKFYQSLARKKKKVKLQTKIIHQQYYLIFLFFLQIHTQTHTQKP